MRNKCTKRSCSAARVLRSPRVRPSVATADSRIVASPPLHSLFVQFGRGAVKDHRKGNGRGRVGVTRVEVEFYVYYHPSVVNGM